ncbi:MAG TPA: DNA methyltransferase [Longimicrobium sp.]|nr:DNA methyltransferase [Longimicrobium sp.]
MDRGDVFGWKQLLRFNGHFFADAEVLPLVASDLAVLHEAAQADWRYVEPTIFGTLLTRALDPKERHRLGAEYTPREYVERVVRQTVDVPLRERWAPVQAHAAELAASKRKKDRDVALGELRAFHKWLRGLRFLDPACGSGNFLYVTLHTVKRLELEVLRAIEEITGNPELGIEEVGPWQFHGIEIKPWAREIAELTLWIGYHQFWMEHHKGVNPPEPVLQDTGTLEQRDAVLAWDEIVEIPEKSRPDPTPRIPHPVTGKLVPDPNARLPYFEHRGARQAEWPQADFIIGNPPYTGARRMRILNGEGYVDALHKAFPNVPDGADFVMYWWYCAAECVSLCKTIRAGLITTNSITQTASRRVVEAASDNGAKVVWAVADHPWVEESDGAAVRVAMTVIAASGAATRVWVDERGQQLRSVTVSELHADLSFGSGVVKAAKIKLQANRGLTYMGVKLVGGGFILTKTEAERLRQADPKHSEIVRPYAAGRDLSAKNRDRYVIDFALRAEDEAKQFPILYDLIRDRVKRERDANKGRYQAFWWQFGVPNAERRIAAATLPRVIATVETSRYRWFTFIRGEVVPDGTLITIASDDPFIMGVLSSTIHVTWALATGGRLGVGNDPRYSNGVTFDPFPFPDPPTKLREEIGCVAERLDQHRKDAIARDERVTMTGMYNVVEKLRSGEKLTEKERAIHEIAACGVLRDLHDELDALVARAYGWPWPLEREEALERLVALHDERVEEEKRGIIRWLRPEYQAPRFGGAAPVEAPTLDLPEETAETAPTERAQPWPAGAVEQIGAVKACVGGAPATPAEVAAVFIGAPKPLVARYLETLAMVGEVRILPDGRYEAIVEPL